MISSTQGYVGYQGGRRHQGQGGVNQELVGLQLFRRKF